MNKFYWALLFISLLMLSIRLVNAGEAEKKQIVQAHDIARFNAISLSGVGNLYIKQSSQESLTVEADDVVRSLIQMSVKDKVLYLDLKDASKHSQAKINYYVNIKNIQTIYLNTSSTIYIPDGLDAKELTVFVSNLGEVDMTINVNKLIAKIDRGGRIEAKGIAGKQEVVINGAGEFDGSKLVSTDAVLTLSGSGLAKTNVSGTLAANVSGEGKVMYCGKPSVNKIISDDGKVLPLDLKECQ